MRIIAVGTGFPAHYYEQDELLAALRRLWAREHFNAARLERLHKNVLVGGRHLALPLEAYNTLDSWGEANDAWIRVGLEVGAAALEDAFARSGVSRDDIGLLLFTSVTGIATPSLDARLVDHLGLSPTVKRLPLFGLGCVAGAAGVARAADYVKAFPDEVAIVLSVELCSLTVQQDDLSIPNLIATGLFGDGAAAAVVVGDQHALADRDGPRVVATRSVFYPQTQDVMGWDISERGFRIVLSSGVPDMVRGHLRSDLEAFLGAHDLGLDDIGSWVAHPGGPKVLEAMAETFDLGPEALAVTWRSLREVGNLSSTSVLLVLEETLRDHRPAPGTWGVMLAMGPGFCSELVLLSW